MIENYNIRFEKSNEQARKNKELQSASKNNFSPPPLINFSVYMKNHYDNAHGGLDNIVKYQILDSCVRDFYDEK